MAAGNWSTEISSKKFAQGRIEHTQGMIFSADEGADVGEDGETPVVEDYGIPAPYRFTGTIHKVTIDLKKMKQADKAAEKRGQAIARHQWPSRNKQTPVPEKIEQISLWLK